MINMHYKVIATQPPLMVETSLSKIFPSEDDGDVDYFAEVNSGSSSNIGHSTSDEYSVVSPHIHHKKVVQLENRIKQLQQHSQTTENSLHKTIQDLQKQRNMTFLFIKLHTAIDEGHFSRTLDEFTQGNTFNIPDCICPCSNQTVLHIATTKHYFNTLKDILSSLKNSPYLTIRDKPYNNTFLHELARHKHYPSLKAEISTIISSEMFKQLDAYVNSFLDKVELKRLTPDQFHHYKHPYVQDIDETQPFQDLTRVDVLPELGNMIGEFCRIFSLYYLASSPNSAASSGFNLISGAVLFGANVGSFYQELALINDPDMPHFYQKALSIAPSLLGAAGGLFQATTQLCHISHKGCYNHSPDAQNRLNEAAIAPVFFYGLADLLNNIGNYTSLISVLRQINTLGQFRKLLNTPETKKPFYEITRGFSYMVTGLFLYLLLDPIDECPDFSKETSSPKILLPFFTEYILYSTIMLFLSRSNEVKLTDDAVTDPPEEQISSPQRQHYARRRSSILHRPMDPASLG